MTHRPSNQQIIEITTTTIINEVEYQVEVWFDYEPEERGQRDAFGVPIEPDYPDQLNFNCASILGHYKGSTLVPTEGLTEWSSPSQPLIEQWREEAADQL